MIGNQNEHIGRLTKPEKLQQPQVGDLRGL
jgi:hypothetical protein